MSRLRVRPGGIGSTGRLAPVVAALAVGAVVVGLAGCTTASTEAAGEAGAPVPTGPVPEEAVPDGERFGFVTLASTPLDERVVLRIDVAELLTGAAAHDAAVADGSIGEHDELPNDVYVVDPDHDVEMLAISDDAGITVLVASADQPLTSLVIRPVDLSDAMQGSVGDASVYGVIPGEPVPMRLTVQRGFVVAAEQVYLP